MTPWSSLVRFGHALRREGVPAGPARIRTFCEAAAVLAPADLYWAGRASLVWRPEHIPVYDKTFRALLRRRAGPGTRAGPRAVADAQSEARLDGRRR